MFEISKTAKLWKSIVNMLTSVIVPADWRNDNLIHTPSVDLLKDHLNILNRGFQIIFIAFIPIPETKIVLIDFVQLIESKL